MLKKQLLSLGMVLSVLTIAGCAAQKEPVQPDDDKRVENTSHAASPEPTKTPTPTPEATAAPTAEPENIFDRIPTEGNVWKVNEVEREGIRSAGHTSPDWHPIFHEMTREEVLSYFDMKLDLADFLPELKEKSDRKYGFYEYQFAGGNSTGIRPEESFYYYDEEEYPLYPEAWARYVIVGFGEGRFPNYSSVEARVPEEVFNNWEPEVSVIQGQEVRIVHLTVKREDVVYSQFYFADFLSNDLGVTIEAKDMEWEDIKKVIEYLVYYALEREGG